jgi:hypothetical protein
MSSEAAGAALHKSAALNIRKEITIMAKSKPRVVTNEDTTPPPSLGEATPSQTEKSHEEKLDAEEIEFRKMRRDLPGVKGSAAAGIVTIAVVKAPQKETYFRTHPDPDFRPVVPLVETEIGIEKSYFAVAPDMIESLAAIGIAVYDAMLYFIVTSTGALRIVPVRCANDDGNQNEYHRTKEIGLIKGIDGWVRVYSDQENHCYRTFPAPEGRFGEPQFPDLKPAKIFKLAFRDKGRLIDSPQHKLFQKWAACDSDE